MGRFMEESRKVYGWLVRDENAAAGCSSLWADIMGEETPIRFVSRQVVNRTNINDIIYEHICLCTKACNSLFLCKNRLVYSCNCPIDFKEGEMVEYARCLKSIVRCS